MSSARIHVFKPEDDIPADFVLLLYGKRRTGKNTMLLHMLETMKDRFENHKVDVFSGTAGCHPAQYKYFPPASVHCDIGMMESTISELMNKQIEDIYKEVRRQLVIKKSGGKIGAATPGGVQNKHTKRGAGDSSGMRAVEMQVEKGKEKEYGKKRKFNSADASAGAQVRVIRGRLQEKENHGGITAMPDVESNGSSAKLADDDTSGITDAMVWQALRDEEYDKSFMPRRLIILDDVVDDNSVRYCPSLNKLAVSGRHWYFSVIILSQCIAGSGSVPPIIRINADLVIVVYNPRSCAERKLLSEQYLTPSGNDAKAGLKLLAEITRVTYRAIVIDTVNPNSSNYSDFIFTYGPVPEPPNHVSSDFRMGTEKQWEEPLPGEREPVYNDDEDGTQVFSLSGKTTRINSGRFSRPVAHNMSKGTQDKNDTERHKRIGENNTIGVRYLNFNQGKKGTEHFFNALF